MGIISRIKRRKEKRRLMEQLIDALQGQKDSQELEQSIRQFYDFISDDYTLGPIIGKYNHTDYKLIRYLILTFNEMCGGRQGGWVKNKYVPVAAFASPECLDCALLEYHLEAPMERVLDEVKRLL